MPLSNEELRASYEAWRERIVAMHEGPDPRCNEDVPFTALTKPLGQARVALVTTAGAHLDDQDAFDVDDPGGDASYRLIPNDAVLDRLRFSHSHYDTSQAEQDPNVVLPLEPLQKLVAEGVVGEASPWHVGMMGFNPAPARLIDETGPQVADELVAANVDVAVFTPG